MRILMASGLYDVSGISSVIENVSNRLIKNGIDVTIGSFIYKKIPSGGKYDIERIPLCIKNITDYLDGFDIIHSHHPTTNYLSLMTKKPFIYQYHGAPNVGLGLLYRNNMIFTNILTKHKIKFVICVSKSGYQEYKQFFDPLNIAIIPNGVDTAFFKCDNLEKYRKGVPQFIFVGNLYDHKNVAEIIMAIKELIKYYPKISLVIVGTGSSYNRLKKLVNDLNLQKHVRFTGQVTKDLPSYYSSSDVYVSASKSESSPLPPIEGMTCGLPSLLSSINPHIELIKNSGAGMIYEIGNVKDLSVKMIEIYEKRISFINHAFNYSRLNDWDYLVKNYISIYNKLLIK